MSGVIGVEEGERASFFGGVLQDEDALMALSRGSFPSNYTSSGYEKSAVVKTGRATLYGFTVRTSRTSAQWIQIHDRGAVPSSGNVPRFFFDIAAASTLFVMYGMLGRRFDSGCIIVNSTTDTTYTAGSADCWFDCQYV